MGCCESIPQDQVAIVERFGKFEYMAEPGCMVLPVPCICTKAGTVSLRIQQLNVQVESKTKDNVFVTLVVAVQYEVLREKVYEAFYKLANPGRQINSYVFDVCRATVPKLNIDEVFESKEQIATQIREQLESVSEAYHTFSAQMWEFGFRIHEALVIDIEPDTKVKTAMNEINAHRRLRIAAQEKAEADKIILVKRAEAEAESKFLQGEGIARQRRAIVDGLKDSVADFSEQVSGMQPKDVLELVLITQYFDTLKEVGASSQEATIFVPHNPGSLSQLSSEIRRGFMSK